MATNAHSSSVARFSGAGHDGRCDRRDQSRLSRPGFNRVLIASSDAQERERWTGNLLEAGYRVSAVSDGHSTLRAIEHECFDIVVSAVTMNTLDGLELLRAVADRPKAPAIILITPGCGDMDRIYMKSAKLHGAASAYTQPLNVTAFLEDVRTISRRGIRVIAPKPFNGRTPLSR